MVRLCTNFALFLVFVFIGIIFYNVFLKEWIKRIKLNKMFKANHNCKNCKHCRYIPYKMKECNLNFHRKRDYISGQEEKIYKDVRYIIGTRKCHWDPREEKNV